MRPRFVQIHTLSSYPAALLNRDDVGFAKRIPFGGATRTRISSQCLKRHWRDFEGENSLFSLDVPQSIRSRITFDQFILKPLIDSGTPEPVASAAVAALRAEVLGESAKAKKAKKAKEENGAGPSDDAAKAEGQQTGQVTVLGRPEVDYLLSVAQRICGQVTEPKKVGEMVKAILDKEGKKNLQSLRLASGLDAALFGRMVTSDILSRGDAALHVAHAFTVHEEQAEADYFSAVDDLLKSGDDKQLGSGHIGSVELTSGLYYGYVVADLPLLVSNVQGCERKNWEQADPTLASRVIEKLIHLVATVSPGAKLGSTAPYSYAHMVLVEAGNSQPRTLANAFLTPVDLRPDVLRNTYHALTGFLKDLDTTYGWDGERAFAAMGPKDILETIPGLARMTVPALSSWAGQKARGA